MSIVLKARSSAWRRAQRFRSLALSILVPVAGAWVGWIIGIAHAQNTAVAAIERAGGAVLYSHQYPRLNSVMMSLFGIDCPRTVSDVFLRESGSGADLIHLKSFGGLKFLCLERSNVDDSGLNNLEGLKSLEHLILAGTKITDAGLAHLKRLTKLTNLELADARITDAGLVHLTALTGLSKLDLRGTRVTTDGVRDLKRALPNVSVRL
jgi:hypothetical protein